MMRIISTFFQKNERWLTPTVLFGGFILDNLTLRRVDLLAENILLAFYFLLVFVGVLLWHKFETKRIKNAQHLEYQSLIFLMTQFAFGGLFSSLTVFYIKSASIFASWPFILILFGGMIATEYLKKHFTQFLVQIGTLYMLLFAYFIMIIPLFVRLINTWVFIFSGILSLVAIFAYVFIFSGYVPKLIKGKEKYVLMVIGGVFAIVNIFYFTNIIPPIPLALKDSGVYQKVDKQGNSYKFLNFKNRFSLKDLKQEYTVPANSSVYFYSSVYAPVKFKQKIVHNWQKKNIKGDWVTISKVDFPIYGGNDAGYRGYSISGNVTVGEYRVLVETDRGQVLGGETFIVRR